MIGSQWVLTAAHCITEVKTYGLNFVQYRKIRQKTLNPGRDPTANKTADGISSKNIRSSARFPLTPWKEYVEKFKEKMIVRVGDYVNSQWAKQEEDFKRWERQKGNPIYI